MNLQTSNKKSNKFEDKSKKSNKFEDKFIWDQVTFIETFIHINVEG